MDGSEEQLQEGSHQLIPKPERRTQPENKESDNSMIPCLRQYEWWARMIIYSFFVVAGQSAGTLLGRVYFDNGGESEWMATLVQVIGFVILVPFQWLTVKKTRDNRAQPNEVNEAAGLILSAFYVITGIFLAVDCMLYSIGLQYVPVTTYTLICASQLGFNALFSYFINSQKFTPYIVNSLVLLSVSSVLLVFQTDPGDSNKAPEKKYAIGFLCTLAASACYALMLSLTQLAFQKVIKKETIGAIIDMTVYQNLVATLIIVIGLFASGGWEKLGREMMGYKLGRVSYVMNLVWTSVSWVMFGVGCVGLIFKVSSLFSNVISILGLPVAPVLAVIFLGDKLTGLKGVAMLLAVWGFVSYAYQQYIDDSRMKEANGSVSEEGGEQIGERGSETFSCKPLIERDLFILHPIGSENPPHGMEMGQL